MMGFAGMERDTVTGLNLAVNRVENPGTGRWTSQDPLDLVSGDANLYRYADDNSTGEIDPTGLQGLGPSNLGSPVLSPGYLNRPTLLGPVPRPTGYPTAPNWSWTPGEFFGPFSPLITATGWGCGALAAWRVGGSTDAGGLYHPMQIFRIPGVRYYLTNPNSPESIEQAWQQAQARMKELEGKGMIIVVQHAAPNWTPPWDGGGPFWGGNPSNYATYWGTYWEYCNHGDLWPDRKIIHKPAPPGAPLQGLPDVPIRTIVVVPLLK